MTKSKVRTAVFPVAGKGTRFLPATRSVPKELLPVIDTPLLQFAIEEAQDAGIERIVFVSHPSKGAIEHFARQSVGDSVEPAFAMQHEQLGLGHAVLCAAPHLLSGPVAVVLPDDLILGQRGCLSQMVEAYGAIDEGHLIAAMEVPRADVSSYGVLSVKKRAGDLYCADGMVEKPAPEEAPSNLAVVGRYILDACIFDTLASTTPGAGGEIQLTDAIAADIARVGLAGFAFDGQRFDCGSKRGMLAATLARASDDPKYAEVLEGYSAQQRRFAAE